MRSLRVAAVAATAVVGSLASPSVLSPSSAWIVDSSVSYNTAIDLALRDLREDWYKVIGVPAVAISSAPTSWAGDAILTFSQDTSLPAESFWVNATASGLQVTGADTRGLVYGIYQVSGDFLGVDPMHWFLDIVPAFAGAIDIPRNYSYWSGVPSFYSRGGFNNDEEISGYFFKDVVGDSVFSATMANRLCEALLRLRANTFIPSTFAYVDERHYRVLADRGMIQGNHHVMPLGHNVYAFPKGVPYAYRINPEPFHFLWNALTTYQQQLQGREMMYSVGYRGVNDEPFWNQDPDCNTDQCRGAVISAAIANQTQIALGTPSVHTPRFVSYMWMELLELRQAGTLILPPNVSCIWTDFPGSFNILGVVNASQNDGFYAHIQMMSGQAAQITEFVPPERMFRNMWEFLVRKATAYGMINLSDLKFVPLTAEAVYRYLWSPASFNTTTCPGRTAVSDAAKSGARRPGRRGPVGWWPMPRPDAEVEGCGEEAFGSVSPWQAQDAFILEFATRHFGGANSSVPAAVASIYGSYFNISYMSDTTTNNKGDHYLGSELRNLVGAFDGAAGSNQKPSSLASLAKTVAAFAAPNVPFVSDLFLNQVLPLAPYIPAGIPSTVYAAHVTAQVAVHHFHLLAFQATAAGALAYMAGDSASALANVTSALQAMDSLMVYLREGEGNGLWRGVYAQESWTWCWGSRVALAHLQGTLSGAPVAPAPNNPYPDYAFMTYECPPNDPVACSTFPFSGFNATVAWDVMVRVSCAADVPAAAAVSVDAGASAQAVSGGRALRKAGKGSSKHSDLTAGSSCSTTFSGVTFNGASAQIGLFTAALPQRGAAPVVRYTLDGSEVTPTSQLYTAPFSVSGNTTVKARAFDALTGQALAVGTLAPVVQQAA